MRRPAFRARDLTDREREYILDAARGLTAQQSAKLRGVSLATANAMRQRVQSLLGGHNITHTVALALRHGAFTTDDL